MYGYLRADVRVLMLDLFKISKRYCWYDVFYAETDSTNSNSLNICVFVPTLSFKVQITCSTSGLVVCDINPDGVTHTQQLRIGSLIINDQRD